MQGPYDIVITSPDGHDVAVGGGMWLPPVQPGDPEFSRTNGKKKGFL